MINKLGDMLQVNIIPIENKYRAVDYIPMRENYNSNKPYICKSIKDYKLDTLYKEYTILLGYKIQVPFGFVARLYPIRNLIEKYGVISTVSVMEYYPENEDNVLALPVACVNFKNNDHSLIPDKSPIAELVIDSQPSKTILNVVDDYTIPPYFSED